MKRYNYRTKKLYESVSVCKLILDEVDENLMSKKHPNLYFVGECLDVDGLCGGYNLAWAWASAILVGEQI